MRATESDRLLPCCCADQSNSSVWKSGLLGAMPMRQLPADAEGSLRGDVLEAAIRSDRHKGLIPCFVSRQSTSSRHRFDVVSNFPSHRGFCLCGRWWRRSDPRAPVRSTSWRSSAPSATRRASGCTSMPPTPVRRYNAHIFLRSPYSVFVVQWLGSCYPTRKVRGSTPKAVILFVAYFYPFS